MRIVRAVGVIAVPGMVAAVVAAAVPDNAARGPAMAASIAVDPAMIRVVIASVMLATAVGVATAMIGIAAEIGTRAARVIVVHRDRHLGILPAPIGVAVMTAAIDVIAPAIMAAVMVR